MRVVLFIRFLIKLNLLWRCIARPKGVAIRGYDIKVGSVEVIVAFGFEAVVHRIGALCVKRSSIKVILVGPFRQHFRLSIKAILALVIILDRVVVSH